MDSQKGECNGRYLNKANGPLFIFKQSIHTLALPPPFYCPVLSEHGIWWIILWGKVSYLGGAALYHGL